MTFAVKGFLPSGAVCVIATARSHRKARNVMLDREVELRARFGISLFVGEIRGTEVIR